MLNKDQIINDRYEIIKNIGEGGMANVYLAKDTFLNRKVAIKVLRGDLSNDDKFIRRFQREAIAASSLSHSNIVEMYDVGEDNGIYYIVMEYLEGKTLKQLIKKRGNITLEEAIDIMLQLTDGISHAHESYIIHRDLKPQNIMILDDGKIKITDFGIAVAINSTQLTQTNSVMGSVHYLPPEQASGKGATIKSDIYSMGIMFYELLTGKIPFRGDNAVEIALKHMKDEIPSVRKINSDIPQSVENILLKSTAKNPKNRYDDVKTMYEDLKTCLDKEHIKDKKYEYLYDEYEIDEKYPLTEENKETEDVAKKVGKVKRKKEVSFTGIIISVLSLILVGGVIAMIAAIVPALKPNEDIKIPDVSKLSVVDAEKALVALGFKVDEKTIKQFSETFEKGTVIGTDPAVGRLRSKGNKITLIESLGPNNKYEIENYVGKNYIEVQTTLEKVYKMKVVIEKKDVEITDNMNLQNIIDQSIKPGESVIISEDNPAKIILYIPNAYEQYPDFVAEGWNIEDIKAFCVKYELSLDIRYEPNSSLPDGSIIKQSRTGKIVNKTTLIITVVNNNLSDEITPPETITP